MDADNYLIDADTGQRCFRVRRMLAAGRSCQIVLAEPAEAAGGGAESDVVCARVVSYEADRLDDRAYVQGRQDALRAEHAFLEQADSPLLADPVAFFRVATDQPEFSDEPVLVYEYAPGQTLLEWLRREHPDGLAVPRALKTCRRIVEFLVDVHAGGYVFRDLDPRHVIVDDHGSVTGMVGFGNAAATGERPNPHKLSDHQAVYVAPEVRAERSGRMLRPAADAYAVGALLSFMLSGEEPREVVENPLSWAAYNRLSNLEPPGIALLAARLIQPLAKHRFGRLERLLPFMNVDDLPTAQTQGFGMLMLPAPFSGVEDPDDNRALKSHLSSGPLISVDDEAEVDASDEVVDTDPVPRSWAIGAVVLALVSVAALIALDVI